MRRRILQKGNIHRADRLRALVTETLAGDVPIIISNDGFYKNLKKCGGASNHPNDFIKKVLTNRGSARYTVPYRYNLARRSNSPRILSLIHPASQIALANFYDEFGHLICYFSRKSKASIRSPNRIGSLFFVRGRSSEQNRLKGAGVDTVEIENAVSNPASYFSYRGYRRAHEFFNSSEYVELERRYPVMALADVSKCFHSIYTHTLFWAVSDRSTAKDNTGASSFSNNFDKLMQLANFNETNGICIGPEISRLFAEIILSEVDRRAIEDLSSSGMEWGQDYEFRRYVDDYYVFAGSDLMRERVLHSLGVSLAQFNLHLNERKTEFFERPFVTTKSRMIAEANAALEYFDQLVIDGSRDVIVPKRIIRPEAVFRSFLMRVKAACFDNDCGYDQVANYIIGAMASRVQRIIGGYSHAADQDGPSDEDYVKSLYVCLEVSYFCYSVSPSVPSSLRLAQSTIETYNFVKSNMDHRKAFVAEMIVSRTHQFVGSFYKEDSTAFEHCVPLPVINLLLVLGELHDNHGLIESVVEKFCVDVEKFGYFEIVSVLFCVRDRSAFSEIRDQIFKRAKKVLSGGAGPLVDAEVAMLAFDLIACPFLSVKDRRALLNIVRKRSQLSSLSKAEGEVAVAEFEAEPWFVQWERVDLLRLIRKKELSSVY